MSFFSKIRGTIETAFTFGLSGSQIKANVAALEARLNDDSAFAIVRGLDPVAANDLVTKNYADTGVQGGAIREVRFVIGTGAAQNSATTIPANAQIIDAELLITTSYTAGGAIAIGQTGSTSLLQGTTDNTPQSANRYAVDQDTAWGATPRTVLVTITGAPAAGAGVVIVRYTTPAA